jgi:lipoate-protein ligase A
MVSLERGEAPPTFRLYRWKPSAISIGAFQSLRTDNNLDFCFLQSIRTEVDLEFCKAHGIDVVRRLTGGSAVYHDSEGEITYSLAVPKGHRLAPPDIEESYKIICQGVVSGLKRLGINAAIKHVNDIHAGGKKISGSAQTRTHNCVLQHGSVMLGLDMPTVFSVLRLGAAGTLVKVTREVQGRMTSVRELLGRQAEFSELRDALVAGFSEALNVNLVSGDLSRNERNRAAELVASKYGTEAWNFLR